MNGLSAPEIAISCKWSACLLRTFLNSMFFLALVHNALLEGLPGWEAALTTDAMSCQVWNKTIRAHGVSWSPDHHSHSCFFSEESGPLCQKPWPWWKSKGKWHCNEIAPWSNWPLRINIPMHSRKRGRSGQHPMTSPAWFGQVPERFTPPASHWCELRSHRQWSLSRDDLAWNWHAWTMDRANFSGSSEWFEQSEERLSRSFPTHPSALSVRAPMWQVSLHVLCCSYICVQDVSRRTRTRYFPDAALQ